MWWQADWEGSGEPWNPATSTVLQPDEAKSFGWRLHLAPSIRQRDPALHSAGLAVLQGIPGMLHTPC